MLIIHIPVSTTLNLSVSYSSVAAIERATAGERNTVAGAVTTLQAGRSGDSGRGVDRAPILRRGSGAPVLTFRPHRRF